MDTKYITLKGFVNIMTHIFENLKVLKEDMENKGWVIESFYFKYKKRNYIVLVKLLEESEKAVAPAYTLLKLEFLRENDFSDILSIYANVSTFLDLDIKRLRQFFGIEFSNNLGDIIAQFKQAFATYIPTKVNDNKSDDLKEAMCQSLSESDSEDPRKIYCTSVTRKGKKQNGELKQRSKFNDNKTRLFRPSLYERVGADTNISFNYSIYPEKKNSDEVIIQNMIKNKYK